MNFQFYFERLEDSKVFREFMKENPKAYFCSGFFTLDKDGNDNQRHLDFYIPDKKEMVNFKINSMTERGVEKVPVEKSEIVPEPLETGVDFDFEEIESMIVKGMERKEIKQKVQKILISLQNVHKKPVLICTVFISGLGLLRVNFDLSEGKPKIILFEKKSFFDVIRRVK
jgi:hypothetical protein